MAAPLGSAPRLTKGDLEVLAIIEAELQVHGRTPSVRQIARKRDHKAHGPTQRAINRLLAAGRIQPAPDGGWEVPGLLVGEPFTAPLLDAPKPTWVAAPAPGLVAWQLGEKLLGLPAETIVFVLPGAKVNRYSLCLGIAADGRHYLHRAGENVQAHRTGPTTDRAGRVKLTLVGPVRYALVSYPL